MIEFPDMPYEEKYGLKCYTLIKSPIEWTWKKRRKLRRLFRKIERFYSGPSLFSEIYVFLKPLGEGTFKRFVHPDGFSVVVHENWATYSRYGTSETEIGRIEKRGICIPNSYGDISSLVGQDNLDEFYKKVAEEIFSYSGLE